MKQERIIFPCGQLRLEGIMFKPQSTALLPAVVVCHPHPLYGGTMHNNVTYALAAALSAENICALLFNFRGVGGSTGSFGGGAGEQEDVRAALDYLQSRADIDQSRLGLAGYSFGGGVVLPVACGDSRVAAFALISPYAEGGQYESLKGCGKPKLIVGGGNDNLVTPAEVQKYDLMAGEPKVFEMVKGADHFWGGYEDELARIAAAFFTDAFRQKDQGM